MILMLTEMKEDGRAKCEQYWPDEDEDVLTMEEFQVKVVAETRTEHGYHRTFELFHMISEVSREVKQWQFTTWPKDLDEDENFDRETMRMLEMIRDVKTHQESKVILPSESLYGNASAIMEQARLAQIKPVVLHCGTGIAQTGAMAAILIGLERIDAEGSVNVYTIIRHMRTQRAGAPLLDFWPALLRLVLNHVCSVLSGSFTAEVCSSAPICSNAATVVTTKTTASPMGGGGGGAGMVQTVEQYEFVYHALVRYVSSSMDFNRLANEYQTMQHPADQNVAAVVSMPQRTKPATQTRLLF